MQEEILVELGKKIKLIRMVLFEINQKELCDAIFINQCDLSKIERGKKSTDFRVLIRLSRLSAIPFEYFSSEISYSQFLGLIVEMREENNKNLADDKTNVKKPANKKVEKIINEFKKSEI